LITNTETLKKNVPEGFTGKPERYSWRTSKAITSYWIREKKYPASAFWRLLILWNFTRTCRECMMKTHNNTIRILIPFIHTSHTNTHTHTQIWKISTRKILVQSLFFIFILHDKYTYTKQQWVNQKMASGSMWVISAPMFARKLENQQVWAYLSTVVFYSWFVRQRLRKRFQRCYLKL